MCFYHRNQRNLTYLSFLLLFCWTASDTRIAASWWIVEFCRYVSFFSCHVLSNCTGQWLFVMMITLYISWYFNFCIACQVLLHWNLCVPPLLLVMKRKHSQFTPRKKRVARVRWKRICILPCRFHWKSTSLIPRFILLLRRPLANW